MTISTSVLSYDDCYEVFERALASESGIRVEFDQAGTAQHYVMRLHQARQLRRNQNAEVYSDPDHPMHGKSDYDLLRCSKRKVEGKFFVYLEKLVTPDRIEEL